MKQIELTQGQVALVDDEDADLAAFKWFFDASTGYATRSGYPDTKNIRLHRVVLERKLGRSLTRNERTDHKNKNKLDNRRSNLRVATHSQNQCNRNKPTNNTSGYKGAYRSRAKSERWFAAISVNGKMYHLGTFDTPEAAARAYDRAARKLHGEFASLNFEENER